MFLSRIEVQVTQGMGIWWAINLATHMAIWCQSLSLMMMKYS